MERNILILTTISGFLDKFEMGNVRILKEMGYSIHYAANTKEQHYLFDESEIRDLGVHIHHIDIERSPYMVRNNRKAYLELLRIVREYKIKTVHCHTPVGGVLGRLLGRHFKKDGIKIIYTAHGFHFYRGAPLINNSVYYWAERIMARYTDILIVINREDFENARKFKLRRGGKVYRIPGVGLDMEKFHILSAEEKKRRRKLLGIEEEQFFIVSVGELNENKNHEIVLKTLALMKSRAERNGSGNGIENIIYGICGDGFFYERIKRKIEESGLEEHVRLFGYCKNVQDILGCADMSVFPSKREGLGMAALESLSMGVPVIASDNRGTREYMKAGVNGFIYDCRDAEGFAEGIDKIRGMDGGEYGKMQAECRKTVERFQKKYVEEIRRKVYQDAGKDQRSHGGI